MRRFQILTATVFVGILAACSSPQEDAAKAQKRAFEAQEEVARQRLQLVATYQTCVEDAAGNKLEIEACESYLKASESLK